MIIVTGGAGFIGSNLVAALNAQGVTEILVVDHLKNGHKFSNLLGLTITDYRDREEFLSELLSGHYHAKSIEAIFHLGACSSTTEWDGAYMLDNNYRYSQKLLNYCLEKHIPMIYASSAAIYGAKDHQFVEDQQNQEQPLNVYGYSKYLFDQYVWRLQQQHAFASPVCGLRYFNVYGKNEAHKGSMASVAYHWHQQILQGKNPQLFEGSENFRRDFIAVQDVVKVNLWAWQQAISGIFNCGTGRAQSFVEVADAVIRFHAATYQAKIEYVPFPLHLAGHYQRFTEADLTQLRRAGYLDTFLSVEEGIPAYLSQL